MKGSGKHARLRGVVAALLTVTGTSAAIALTNSCGVTENACAMDCPAGAVGPPGPAGPAGVAGDSFWNQASGFAVYRGQGAVVEATNQDGVQVTAPNGDRLILGVLNGNVRVAGYNTAAAQGRNLILEDSGGNVGIGTASPQERLDVAAPVRLDGMRLFRKRGNNATVSCSTYCQGSAWPGGVGACFGARLNSGLYVSCEDVPGQAPGRELVCMCAGLD